MEERNERNNPPVVVLVRANLFSTNPRQKMTPHYGKSTVVFSP